MWWWRVAHQLDLAQIALVNAMAYNVDDPKIVHALEVKLREAQAVLFEIFKGKGLLPPAVPQTAGSPQQAAQPPVAQPAAPPAPPQPVAAQAPMATPPGPVAPPAATASLPPTPQPPTIPLSSSESVVPEALIDAATPMPTPTPSVPVQEATTTNGVIASADAEAAPQSAADQSADHASSQKKKKDKKDKKDKNGADGHEAHENGTAPTEIAAPEAVTVSTAVDAPSGPSTDTPPEAEVKLTS
jgi:hypothetical protein